MSTPVLPDERAEQTLRAWLGAGDPQPAGAYAVPEHVRDRVLDAVSAESTAPASEAAKSGPALSGQIDATRPSFLRRHWQGGLLVAAGVTSLALAAGTMLPGLGAGSGDASSSAGSVAEAPREVGAGASSLAGGAAEDAAGGDEGAAAGTATASATDPTLVRTASVLVGTDDVQRARESFLTTIRGLGGTVTSETVVTDGSSGSLPASDAASSDVGITYPYPQPSGPGVWLTVKVPAAAYEQAIMAARAQGELVQLQQTSYDVAAQVTDTKARIASLTASLERLRELMSEADGVTEVVRLENAIAERQAELDSLVAQQRELADQTQMSQVSATFMAESDARASVDPNPQKTWWESFVDALGRFWSWLGGALLVLSPLLVAWALIRWVRRRSSSQSTAGSAEHAPEAPSGGSDER